MEGKRRLSGQRGFHGFGNLWKKFKANQERPSGHPNKGCRLMVVVMVVVRVMVVGA
jgi:hypothetical protein